MQVSKLPQQPIQNLSELCIGVPESDVMQKDLNPKCLEHIQNLWINSQIGLHLNTWNNFM